MNIENLNINQKVFVIGEPSKERQNITSGTIDQIVNVYSPGTPYINVRTNSKGNIALKVLADVDYFESPAYNSPVRGFLNIEDAKIYRNELIKKEISKLEKLLIPMK